MNIKRWSALTGNFNSESAIARDLLNTLISFAEDEAAPRGLLTPEVAKRHAMNLGQRQINPQCPQVQRSIVVLASLYDQCYPLQEAG